MLSGMALGLIFDEMQGDDGPNGYTIQGINPPKKGHVHCSHSEEVSCNHVLAPGIGRHS